MVSIGLIVVVVCGYATGFWVFARGLADLDRIPRRAWTNTGYQNRELWRRGMIVSYALGGWPTLPVVMTWRFSTTRAAVREEWKLLHAERMAARRRREEIVLADHEEPDARNVSGRAST